MDLVVGGINQNMREYYRMKEIVDWLLGVEQLAHEVYKTAAAHFLEDKEFSSFCWERDLVYLEKPFKLQKFHAAVQGIMEKSV